MNKEFDVHFSLNGFVQITARSGEEAMNIAEEILAKQLPELEQAACTGLGIEIVEAIDLQEGE